MQAIIDSDPNPDNSPTSLAAAASACLWQRQPSIIFRVLIDSVLK